MPKHTIKLDKEEVRTINIVKAMMDIKSIDKAISFIINDYSKNKDYLKTIERMRGKK